MTLIVENVVTMNYYFFTLIQEKGVSPTFLSPELLPLVATILHKFIEFSVGYEILGGLKLRNSIHDTKFNQISTPDSLRKIDVVTQSHSVLIDSLHLFQSILVVPAVGGQVGWFTNTSYTSWDPHKLIQPRWTGCIILNNNQRF